jgi:hypothetical protein
MVSVSEDHSTLYLKCAVEEPLDLVAETLCYQESQTQLPCNSSLIRRHTLSRVGNTKTDQSTSSHLAAPPTCKSGTPTQTGGRLSRLKERTLSTPEAESLMLQEALTMRTKTSSLPKETTK